MGVVFATAGLVLLGIAVIMLAGYGPTLLLLDRKEERSRAIAIPGLGLACFLVLTHVLAGLYLNGTWISILTPLLFAALAIAVPRKRRLNSREIRESLGVFAICCGGLVLAVWPLVREGCRSYLAFGNPDAAFNLAMFEGAQLGGYRDPLLHAVSYWPAAPFGVFFGAGYLCVLLAVLTRTDILGLHEVASSVMVFVIPAATFWFSVSCLKAARKKAILAAVMLACSSQICYTFYLESIGAMTLIALLPVFLALCTEMLEIRSTRTAVCLALAFAGTSFGYYASIPILGLLFAAAVAIAMAKGLFELRDLWRPVAIIAGVVLLAFPALTVTMIQRSLKESGSTRLTASLNGPEVLLSFAFALTEQYLPFFWGLIITPLSSGTPFEPPALIFLAVLSFAALLCGLLLWLLLRRHSDIPLHVRAQVMLLVLAVAYFILRNNGYGAFKLAAWLTPLTLSILACGILPDGSDAKYSLWNRFRYCLIAAVVVLNLLWAVRLGMASLNVTSIAGKSMAGFSGSDFADLSVLSNSLPAEARILVAIPDAVVERWVLTFLRRSNVSTVPFLSLSAEETDAYETVAAAGGDSAQYVLTWSGSRDITAAPRTAAVWSNSKFQLVPRESVSDLLIPGRGWYAREELTQSPEPWQHRFRWLRSKGELLLLNPSGRELRLRMTVVSGAGDPTPERVITFALNGQRFDQVDTAGITNLVTKPFRGEGFVNHLTLSLPDGAQPIPRQWAMLRRWVPKDRRRLNVAVANVELITEDEYRRTEFPCSLDLSRADAWNTPGLGGIFGDRWIAGKAHVLLTPCGESDAVTVQGTTLETAGQQLPVPIEVSVDGVVQTIEASKPGPFHIAVPLPAGFQKTGRHEILVGSPAGSVAVHSGGPDPRSLSIRLDKIEIRRKAASQ